MGRVVTFLVAAVVLFAAGSGWIALYPPVPRDLGGVEDLDDRAEKVIIPVGTDDALAGWLLPGRRDALIVIFHGYGRDHTRAWRYAQFLRKGGYGILTVNFRSSRASNRKPTTLGAYEAEDARAVLDWIHRRPDLRHQSLGMFGESLGGSVALVAAAGDPDVKVVVVDGAFANGRRALEDASVRWAHLPAWPSALLARGLGRVFTGHDPYALDAEAAARALAGRHTLFIAAENDPRFSEAQARSMWKAAGSDSGGLWVLRGPIGHNEGWLKDRVEYERRVLGFYERNLVPAVVATAAVARPGPAKHAARGAVGRARIAKVP